MKRKSSDYIGDDDSIKRKPSDVIVPKYGTKDYWEARYKSHLPGVSVDDTSYTLDGVVLSKDAIKSRHEWYFTYDELKPLIMPLILGSTDNEVAESDYNECSDAESWVEEEEEEEEEGSDTEPKAENDSSTNDDTQEDTEKDTEEQELPHIDTTNLKPKRVLEIGCGDVPIATSLMSDLLSMQQSDNGSKTNLIEEVTCIDYSEVVIETLIKQQKKLELEQQNTGKKDGMQQLQPTFQALDARSLPFECNTYDLILEKGTMDAMLSDEVDGIPNCIKIVEEMARVTSEGGAILIVSHLNANEDKGMGWLEDIVFSGLKDEFLERRKQKREETKSTKDATTKGTTDDEKEYVWSVEVHGGEGKYLDANGKEIENPSDDDTPTYGACVYIIKKKSVPASIARDLFGKKKKDTTEDSDANSDDEKAELMEMPPVKLEFVTY